MLILYRACCNFNLNPKPNKQNKLNEPNKFNKQNWPNKLNKPYTIILFSLFYLKKVNF